MKLNQTKTSIKGALTKIRENLRVDLEEET
jgi:hypothetical protein